jgi:adenylate cyclase
LAINPVYTPALSLLGFTLTDQARFGWEKDEATTYEAALQCAARALAVDPDSGDAYVALGYTRLFQRRHDEALAAGEKAIALSPNGAGAYHMLRQRQAHRHTHRQRDPLHRWRNYRVAGASIATQA